MHEARRVGPGATHGELSTVGTTAHGQLHTARTDSRLDEKRARRGATEWSTGGIWDKGLAMQLLKSEIAKFSYAAHEHAPVTQ